MCKPATTHIPRCEDALVWCRPVCGSQNQYGRIRVMMSNKSVISSRPTNHVETARSAKLAELFTSGWGWISGDSEFGMGGGQTKGESE